MILWNFFPNHKLLWGIPFICLTFKYVIQKEEFVHMRAHWPTKMTPSGAVDTTIDASMMIIAGVSREAFKRRHIAAHYADIANFARIFSDVWLPFVTFPAVYYMYPYFILKIALDKEYCEREKLSRKQLFIETFGLYGYLSMLALELYFGSYYLLVFHLLPLLLFHGCEVLFYPSSFSFRLHFLLVFHFFNLHFQLIFFSSFVFIHCFTVTNRFWGR
jgi:hypothetical protein